MVENSDKDIWYSDFIDKPFNFNQLKHHLLVIKSFINNYNKGPEGLRSSLLSLGTGLMDLYTGKLSAGEIAEDLKDQLMKERLFYEEEFIMKLRSESGYIERNISDGSSWILRESIENDRYIHIHPGRYSLHTTRVKATTLKTCIGVRCIYKNREFELKEVNSIRSLLDLSAIKRIQKDRGIGKVLELFF